MRSIFFALLAIASTACGGGGEEQVLSPTERTSEVDDVTTASGLTVRLELTAASVAGGEPLSGTLHIDNGTDAAISDPQCDLIRSRHALVRPGESEPSGGHWNALDHDCGGITYEPGEEESVALIFATNAADGEPLPSGRYDAVVDVPGTTQNLVAPVEVTTSE
tara:strand:- start:214 stop:705 length:492 start_codon:yes stop_codon:yes gene_type:complete